MKINLTPFGNWLASVVRTSIVPAIVGVLGGVAVYANTSLPSETAAVITSGFSFGYWFLVRLLELRFPKAGWLLLMPRPPCYTQSDFLGFVRGAVRTMAPLAVGLVATFLARLGIIEDSSKLMTSLVAVISAGGYYSTVRAVETKKPNAGLLLGMRGAPTYAPDNGELHGGDHE